MMDITHSKNTAEAHYRNIATGKKFQLGLLASFITVCIWASWLVSVKMGVQSAFTSFDLALMRYGVPAVVLLPFLYQSRSQLLSVPVWTLFGIVLGAGVPFFLLSSQGMHYAPVSHAGLLLPGTFPLFVTGIAFFVFKEPLSRPRFVGLLAIMFGVIALLIISMWSLKGDVWKGDLLFLGASFFWAVYTISLRVAGLPPLAATGLLSVVSLIVLCVIFLVGDVASGLGSVSVGELLWQFIVQAILVGLFAGFSYGYAINLLGAERTAAMGALTPVLAAIMAIPLLQESVGLAAAFGLCFVCVGVVLASGIVKLPYKSH